VLQNSKNGFQRFFREKSNQAIIADRCVRAAEVAGEFITCVYQESKSERIDDEVRPR
jgi:hypothetical protein